MAYSGRILTIFTLVTCFASTVAVRYSLVNYIVATINHLAAAETAVPKVVFYDLSPRNPFHDGLLGRVIRDPRLDSSVSRIVISCGANMEQTGYLPAKPTLIVLQGDVFFCINRLAKHLRAFSSSTKVLVLVTSEEQAFFYKQLVLPLLFYIVVVMEERLFASNRFFSLNGIPITIIERPLHRCKLFTATLVRSTASLMNTTVLAVLHSCHRSSTFCYEMVMIDNSVDFDCTYYSMRSSQERNFETLATTMTSSEVVLIPSSPLSIIDLFFIPFDWKVWVVLSVLIGILEIIHLMYSSTFRNDPFLFIVCGFQKHDLNQTTRREKLILLALVVFMFFMTNAYSTKLIELLINRPSSHPIRTLQALVDSGIKIKSNTQVNSYLSKHHILGNSTVVSNESVFNMDMVHAHVVVRETAVGVLPMYYDHKHRMFRYNILDQTLNTVVYKFRLLKRSPLLEAFQLVCAALIEAGIKDYLTSLAYPSLQKLGIMHTEVDEMLHFADLTPAWMGLLGGLIIAGVAFGLELALFKIVKK
ncbi:conserved hypothetical protein [Culex quinquefasciatus]|uniref:Ionotropic glutamate receptor C-terminal domain-containing protein n=1 Tax=Culex quinquefasciatus TaxID=7176 RepID=B0XJV9_CULQU|nr:conserved hypothetical protein [Culex quinquefasciatus]|eukprot:XP_001869931.1 conserved hypothetical protein [Culex quinquefasciatus]